MSQGNREVVKKRQECERSRMNRERMQEDEEKGKSAWKREGRN